MRIYSLLVYMFHEVADAKFELDQTLEELNKNPLEHDYTMKVYLARDKYKRTVAKIIYMANQERYGIPDTK